MQSPTTGSETQYYRQRAGKINLVSIGCLGFIGLIAFAIIFGAIKDHAGPDIAISGDSGSMHYKVNSLDTAYLVGHSVAQEVYAAATKHPELKSVTVELELEVAGGAVDKYGNAVEGPFRMGVITVKDLDEVRKYADRISYTSRYSKVFEIDVSVMKYSHLLEKK